MSIEGSDKTRILNMGRIIKILLTTTLIAISVFVFAQDKIVNILSFGANPDGKTLNTISIQKAIDRMHLSGGGRVVIPIGKFVTGPIEMKSGIELHLSKGAVLLGSSNRFDYGKGPAQPLIHADHASNISITGRGEIDGRGVELVKEIYKLLEAGKLDDRDWKRKRPEESNRPKMLMFSSCENITVKGITIKNGSGWIQDYVRCNNLIIDSIVVNSVAYWNNDGIDITNSKNVSITNCDVNAADDAICLKSELRDSCVNVFVANCRLRSSANALKLGTSSHGGFRNIIVRDIAVYDTYRSAIALEAVDGGFLEQVDVKNIRALNTGNAIFIKLGHRNNDDRYSVVRNIRISDMYVEVPLSKPDKSYAYEGPLLRYPAGWKPSSTNSHESISPWNHTLIDSTAIIYKHNVFPSSISGLPGHPVQNISLHNIEIVYEGGADSSVNYFPLNEFSKITEAEKSYPEFSMFGELPCWGMYLRHAENIQFSNVTIRSRKPDFRIACLFDDVKGLSLERLAIPSYSRLPLIFMNNVTDTSFRSLQLPVDINKAITAQ